LRDYGAVPKTFNIEVIKPSIAIRRVRNEWNINLSIEATQIA
jgi:hypothetical protein